MSSYKEEKKKNITVKLRDLDIQKNSRLNTELTEVFKRISLPNIPDISNIIPNSLANITSVTTNFPREEPIEYIPPVNYEAEQIELLKSINSRLDITSKNSKRDKKIINNNQFITHLEHGSVTLYNGMKYNITNGEFKLLGRFLNSSKQEVNLMDISITPNIASLNKMIGRLQLKLDNTIKVNKVRGKKLWYLSK